MIVDIVMPKMGESITEGTILEWRKGVGETIAKDEILLEIGTDKVDSEIPSSYGGIIAEILAEPNEVVEVGKIIARIETEGDGIKAEIPKTESGSKSVSESDPETTIEHHVAPESIQEPIVLDESFKGEKKYYTPVVKAIARKEGVNEAILSSIPGTGKNNRVTKKDLLDYLETRKTAPMMAPLKDEHVEMDKIRRIISEHMRRSLDTAAHVHLMNEVDMTRIVQFVNNRGSSFKASEGFSLTYTPFIIAASIQALLAFPDMNSSVDGTTIIHKKNINIGLAVAVENGLMVPVILNCEELNFLDLCRKVRDLAVRARNKQINPDELSGSTFSISNFGVFNVTTGTPIINQPNVGILGVGSIKKKPVVIETELGDTIGIRSMMHLSLGFDHRLIDGSGGAHFIEMVLNNLENMDLSNLF